MVVATAALEVGYNDPEVGGGDAAQGPPGLGRLPAAQGPRRATEAMRPGRPSSFPTTAATGSPTKPTTSSSTRSCLCAHYRSATATCCACRPPSPSWTGWRGNSRPTCRRERLDGLQRPRRRNRLVGDNSRRRQEAERQILAEVLDGDEARCRSLERYLRARPVLSAEDTQAVLWDPPRPIMTAVIPTLLRRLESGWRRIPAIPAEPTRDYLVRDHPLPDFIPQQLFGDLNLPEVEIVIDPQQQGQHRSRSSCPSCRRWRTLAPGRVTRRFGYRHAFAHHWMPPQASRRRYRPSPVEAFCEEFEEAGTFQIREERQSGNVRCVRPWKIHPRQPPGNVAITSNAQLEWRSQLAPAREDDRLRFEPPRGSAWELRH